MRVKLAGRGGLGATLSAVYGPTGRTVDGNENYAVAQSWAKERCEEAVREHSAAAHFRQALRVCSPIISEVSLEIFRGRNFAQSEQPSSGDFGPPPRPKPGRYSGSNGAVFYACESEEGVSREVLPDSCKPVLWCQQFSLPLKTLRIADFTQTSSAEFVSQVFWFAELAGEPPDSQASFAFSQTVAALVAEHFDGMLVPGVRGDKKFRYRNVVVFRADDFWRRWLLPGRNPQLLHRRSP